VSHYKLKSFLQLLINITTGWTECGIWGPHCENYEGYCLQPEF